MTTFSALSIEEGDRLLTSVCRASFERFCRRFWAMVPGAGKVVWAKHMTVLCRELQDAVEKLIAGSPREYDLVINISPGTSKSTLCSILLPAWVWTRMPHCRILTGSHTDSLVSKLAGKSRDVVKSAEYRRLFPEVQIRPDHDARSAYMTTAGGERVVCTVGGRSPTGEHAHLLIVDDAIDPERVLSEKERATASAFMLDYIANRKVDKAQAVTILVMQRLGIDDPTDAVLTQARVTGAAPVRHICLPAELTRNPDGTWGPDNVSPPELVEEIYTDGLMDSVRLGETVLAENRAKGSLFYATQFLQRPFVRGGGMFRESFFVQRVKAAPYHARRVIYWDRAFSGREEACNTAGTVLAYHEGNWYVGPVRVGRWWPDERDRVILGAAQQCRDRWGPNHEPDVVIEQEPAAGADSYRHLAMKLVGYRVHPDPVRSNKEQRADPWASACEAGNVFLVDDGSWDIAEWVREHCAFPGGSRVDRVDSAGGGFNWLSKRIQKRPPGQFRILPVRGPFDKFPGPRLVVCTHDELPGLVIEHRCLLVRITDPPIEGEGVMRNGDGMHMQSDAAGSERPVLSSSWGRSSGPDVNGAGQEASPGRPLELSAKLTGGGSLEVLPSKGTNGRPPVSVAPPFPALEELTLAFVSLEPADLQERWETALEPWGKPPKELVMQRDQGKALWRLLTKKRPEGQAEVVVFASSGGNRALSLAMAVADTMHLPRQQAVFQVSRPDDKHDGPPPCPHCFEMVKASRALVL